jgi:hypothetical protein
MANKDARAEIRDGSLIITIPMNVPPAVSGSGKSLVVASTYGNVQTDLQVNGKPVVIGVNAYTKL